MGSESGTAMMREMEGLLETVSDTFNSQNVANTLWVYATMERKPGACLMRELEGQVEAMAGTFNE